MNGNEDIGLIFEGGSHWSFLDSVVLVSIEEGSLGFDSEVQIVFDQFTDKFTVNFVVLIHLIRKMFDIVVGNMLLGGSGNSIMMLVDSHPVKDAILGRQDLLHLGIRGLLLNCLHRIKEV